MTSSPNVYNWSERNIKLWERHKVSIWARDWQKWLKRESFFFFFKLQWFILDKKFYNYRLLLLLLLTSAALSMCKSFPVFTCEGGGGWISLALTAAGTKAPSRTHCLFRRGTPQKGTGFVTSCLKKSLEGSICNEKVYELVTKCWWWCWGCVNTSQSKGSFTQPVAPPEMFYWSCHVEKPKVKDKIKKLIRWFVMLSYIGYFTTTAVGELGNHLLIYIGLIYIFNCFIVYFIFLQLI